MRLSKEDLKDNSLSKSVIVKESSQHVWNKTNLLNKNNIHIGPRISGIPDEFRNIPTTMDTYGGPSTNYPP